MTSKTQYTTSESVLLMPSQTGIPGIDKANAANISNMEDEMIKKNMPVEKTF
jgi:hypothetical protein